MYELKFHGKELSLGQLATLYGVDEACIVSEKQLSQIPSSLIGKSSTSREKILAYWLECEQARKGCLAGCKGLTLRLNRPFEMNNPTQGRISSNPLLYGFKMPSLLKAIWGPLENATVLPGRYEESLKSKIGRKVFTVDFYAPPEHLMIFVGSLILKNYSHDEQWNRLRRLAKYFYLNPQSSRAVMILQFNIYDAGGGLKGLNSKDAAKQQCQRCIELMSHQGLLDLRVSNQLRPDQLKSEDVIVLDARGDKVDPTVPAGSTESGQKEKPDTLEWLALKPDVYILYIKIDLTAEDRSQWLMFESLYAPENLTVAQQMKEADIKAIAGKRFEGMIARLVDSRKGAREFGYMLQKIGKGGKKDE